MFNLLSDLSRGPRLDYASGKGPSTCALPAVLDMDSQVLVVSVVVNSCGYDRWTGLTRSAHTLHNPTLPPHLPPHTSPQGVELDVDYRTEVEPFLGPLIGVGGFGRVYEGRWRGRKVAVKVIQCETRDQWQVRGLMRESHIMFVTACCCRVILQVTGCPLVACFSLTHFVLKGHIVKIPLLTAPLHPYSLLHRRSLHHLPPHPFSPRSPPPSPSTLL